MVNSTVKLASSPLSICSGVGSLASVPMSQLSDAPSPITVQPGVVVVHGRAARFSVSLPAGGRVSSSVTPSASPPPIFVTVIVKAIAEPGMMKGSTADFTIFSSGGMSSFVMVQVLSSPIDRSILPSAAQSPPQVPAA